MCVRCGCVYERKHNRGMSEQERGNCAGRKGIGIIARRRAKTWSSIQETRSRVAVVLCVAKKKSKKCFRISSCARNRSLLKIIIIIIIVEKANFFGGASAEETISSMFALRLHTKRKPILLSHIHFRSFNLNPFHLRCVR